MVRTQLFYFIFTGCFFGECFTYENLDVVTLLPSSGLEEVKGQAQQEAIRLATEDLLKEKGLSNATTLGFNFVFADTQCSTTKEYEIILQEFTDRSSYLAVLGGGCLGEGTSDSVSVVNYGTTLDLELPQITFEAGIPWTGEGRRENYLSVKPTYSSAHQVLGKFLLEHSWKQVVVIYEETMRHELAVGALQQHLVQTRHNISLFLPVSHPQLVIYVKVSLRRVIIVHGSLETLFNLICRSSEAGLSQRRLVWLLIVSDVTSSSHLKADCSIPWNNILVFNTVNPVFDSKDYEIFASKLAERVGDLPRSVTTSAAFAYDAASVLLETWLDLTPSDKNLTQSQFSKEFMAEMFSSSKDGLSGPIAFNSDGSRVATTNILVNKNGEWDLYDEEQHGNIDGDPIDTIVKMDVVPLWLWVLVSSLTILAIIYAITIAVFNIVKRADRMIKMTSPNLNVLASLGAIPGLLVVILSGLDSSRVSLDTMAMVLQACSWLLAISFTLMYGCMFSKTWRVFLIFRNLNSNGKNMRDEHLLVAVCVLLLFDIAILLPWTLADCLKCHVVESYQHFDEEDLVEVIYKTDICSSNLQVLWIIILYVCKSCVLICGAYFTYQTRHVTLPTLKDTHEVFAIIFTAVSLAMVCMPILLISRVGHLIKYATASVVMLIVILATLTLAFAPKMYVAWKESDKQSTESLKLQFSESLRRTQENIAKCTICCFSSDNSEKPEDVYAQEMYATEIETLKRTIKEKDATIRELTDRLYFGAEKFQQYLTTPRAPHRHNNSVMMHPVNRKKHQLAHRSLSQPVFHGLPGDHTGNHRPRINHAMPRRDRHSLKESTPNRLDDHSSIQLTVENLARGFSKDSYHDGNQYLNEYGTQDYDDTMYKHRAYRSSSPNNDSAIENTSPSSISSGSYIEQPAYRPYGQVIVEGDQDGMNSIAENEECPEREINLRGNKRDITYRNPPPMQSYYGTDGVAVSQI